MGGAISGTVTASAGGEPLQNINVQLYLPNGTFIYTLPTDSNGLYSFPGLPSGDYKICFTGGSTPYQPKCWDNKSYDPANADAITVAAPATTSGINAALVQGGTITGKVTYDGFNGIRYVNVQLRDTSGNWIPGINGTQTNPDGTGTYSLSGIPTGSYKLYFDGASTGYISEWYDDKTDQSFAAVLDVVAGETLSDKNAVLAQGATISGTVINGSAIGIQNIGVQLYNSTGTMTLSNASTNETGGYQFKDCRRHLQGLFHIGQTYYPVVLRQLTYMPGQRHGHSGNVPGSENATAQHCIVHPGGGISGQVSTGSTAYRIFPSKCGTPDRKPIPGISAVDRCRRQLYLTGHSGRRRQGLLQCKQHDLWRAVVQQQDILCNLRYRNDRPGSTTPLSTAILTVATVPGPPTITSITPGFGQAQVYFNAPASDGGRQIRDYTVTFNPGGFTGSGLNSPINVPGLTNGQNYTVSVTARNDIGNGTAASTPYALPYFVPPGNDLQPIVDAVAANGAVWTTVRDTQLSSLALLITKGITLSGGYNSDFSTVNGYTIIPGTQQASDRAG